MHVGYSVNVMCTFTFAVVGCFKIRRYPTLEVGPVIVCLHLRARPGKVGVLISRYTSLW